MDQLLFAYLLVAFEVCIIHSVPQLQNRRIEYLLFFFFQFFILAGFRGLEVHPDTINYATHFDNVSENGHFWDIDKDIFNTGFLVVEKFIHNNISNTVLVYNLVTSFVICLCTMLLFYREAYHMGIAIFLYFVSGTYFTQMAVLREALAVVVGYCCISLLSKKHFLYAALVILLAITLHTSAIVLFAIFFLEKRTISRKTRIVILLSVIGLVYAIAPVLEMVLDLLSFETKYYAEGVEKGFLTVNGLFNGMVGILVSFGVYKMLMQDDAPPPQSVYLNILYVYFLISVVTLRLSILSRFLMFFNPFIFILVSNYIFLSRRNVKYALFVLLVFASDIVIKQAFRPEWINVFPYNLYSDEQLGLLLY